MVAHAFKTPALLRQREGDLCLKPVCSTYFNSYTSKIYITRILISMQMRKLLQRKVKSLILSKGDLEA